ncbi:hypothetical protein Isolate57625_01500 [Mycobacteroides abscessus subsp. abscessus]
MALRDGQLHLILVYGQRVLRSQCHQALVSPSDADHCASSVICSSTDEADWMSLPATSEKVRM